MPRTLARHKARSTERRPMHVQVEPLESRLVLTPDSIHFAPASSSMASVVVGPDGSSIAGTIEAPEEIDLYEVHIEHSGVLTISQDPRTSLGPIVRLLDADHNEVAPEADLFVGPLTVAVEANQSLFLEVRGFDQETGAYNLGLELTSDDVGPSGLELSFDDFGVAEFTGTIEVSGDTDGFLLQSAVASTVLITLDAVDSLLDPVLTVSDAETGDVLGIDDDSGGIPNSRLALDITPDQPIRITASGFGSTTGNYNLRIVQSLDDVGPDGVELELSETGAVEFTGNIDFAGDTDAFSLNLQTETTLLIALDALGDELDPFLSIRNTVTGQEVSDDDSGVGLNSRIRLRVPANQMIAITTSSFTSAIGPYALRIEAVSEVGDDQATALPLLFDGNVSVSESEVELALSGIDRDFFSIEAPADGLLQVSVDPLDSIEGLDSLVNIRNAAGEIIAVNDDRIPTQELGSLVEFNAEQGATYTIEVRPFDIATGSSFRAFGAYTLRVEHVGSPVSDDTGNTIATAQPISFDDGFALQRVSIDYAADQDVYSFEAPQTGTVRLAHQSISANLNAFLTVFDDSAQHRTIIRSPVPFTPDFASDLEFAVEQGRTYFIRASVFPSQTSDEYGQHTGVYGLGLAFSGQSLQTSTFNLPPQGFVTTFGQIGSPGDTDQFVINTSGAGTVHVSVRQTDGELLNSRLSAFLVGDDLEFAGHVTTTVDGFLDLDLAALADQTFVLLLQGNGESTGSYTLTISQPGADEFPDSITADVSTLPVGGSITGTIGPVGSTGFDDRDAFRLDVPADTVAELVLEVLDSTPLMPGLELSGAFDPVLGAFASGENARRPFRIIGSDDPIYVTVDGFDFDAFEFTQGRYRLSLRTAVSDGIAESFEEAAFIPTDGENLSSIDGQFASSTDSDFYVFTAPFTGQLLIRATDIASNGQPLFSQLLVYDAEQFQLQSGGEFFGEPSGVATAVLSVTQGETLYLELSNRDLRTGSYRIEFERTVITDEIDANGREFTLDENGEFQLTSAIDVAFDSDAFRLPSLADTARTLQFTLDAVGFQLDPVLEVIDEATGNQIAFNDDSGFSLNSSLVVPVAAGQSIRIIASGFGSSAGAYTLRVAEETLIELTPDNTGAAEFTGAIEASGDTDRFLLMPTLTGSFVVALDSTDNSFLDPVLTVFTENGTDLLAFDDDGGRGLNSLLTFDLTEGQAVQIEAAGFASSTGGYRLQIRPSTAQADDDTTFDLPIGRELILNGRINPPFDTDSFTFSAPADGVVTIEQNATDFALDPLVRINQIDGQGGRLQVAFDDDSGPGLNSKVSFNVQQGQSYEIVAGAFGASSGDYELRVQFGAGQDDFGDTFGQAERINLRDGSTFFQGGSISAGSGPEGDVDVFRFESGAFAGTINLRANAFSPGLIPGLAVFRAETRGSRTENVVLVARSEPNLTAPDMANLFVSLEPNQQYFVRVVGVNGSTGDYFLGGSPILDDATDRTAEANELPVPSRRNGEIEFVGDRDVFRVTAPSAGRFRIQLDQAQQSQFDPVLTAYDDRSIPIGRNDDRRSGDLNSELVFQANRPGQIFFLEAAGFENSVGDYQLTVGFEAADLVALEPGNVPRDARPIASPTAQAVNITGQLESAVDVDYYSFVATENGQVTVRLTATNVGGSERVRALAGDPTLLRSRGIDVLVQVASGSLQAQFDVRIGQQYFLEVRSDAMTDALSSDYELSLQLTGDASAQSEEQRANQTINERFQVTLSGQAFDTSRVADEAAFRNGVFDAARNDVMAELRAAASVAGQLDQVYFVLLVDPVDVLITDPVGRTMGFTRGSGTVNEGGGFYSGNGFGESIIVPGAPTGTYQLTLSGLGELAPGQAFRAFAVGPAGAIPVRIGEARSSADGKGVVLALDVASPMPIRGFDVFSQLAEQTLNTRAQSRDPDELTQIALSETTFNFDEPQTLPESAVRSTVRQFWTTLRSLTDAIQEFFGIRLGKGPDEWDPLDVSDEQPTDPEPSAEDDLVPIDHLWKHVGRTLIDAPGALMELLDGFLPNARPKPSRPEQRPEAPEKATTDRSFRRRDVIEVSASRSADGARPYTQRFRKPSPWDYRPHEPDRSWPWARTEAKQAIQQPTLRQPAQEARAIQAAATNRDSLALVKHTAANSHPVEDQQ